MRSELSCGQKISGAVRKEWEDIKFYKIAKYWNERREWNLSDLTGGDKRGLRDFNFFWSPSTSYVVAARVMAQNDRNKMAQKVCKRQNSQNFTSSASSSSNPN